MNTADNSKARPACAVPGCGLRVPQEQHPWGKGWDLDGRELFVTWWGDGVGFNKWSTAKTVFLFDQFYIPRDAVIAVANGYREATAEEGPSGEMLGLTSPQDDVDALWRGHLMRWDLQMGLRGNGRNITPRQPVRNDGR